MSAIPSLATAASLSALSCSSGTVTGAVKDTCTASLTAVAPADGVKVSLSRNDSAVTVPTSVTVPAGASSAHFTATVSAVTTTQTAMLTGSAGGSTKTYALHLKPHASAPALTLQSTSVSFGDVTLNTPSTQMVTLTSSGTSALTIDAGTVTGTGFSISGVSYPATLDPGKTATLAIEFDPKVAGAATGTVTLTDNASAGKATIALTGTGGSESAYEVKLTWDAPSSSGEPVVGYDIYRAASGSSSYEKLNSGVNDPTSYTDDTVATGAAYKYYVTSVDSAGNQSAPSNTFSLTIP